MITKIAAPLLLAALLGAPAQAQSGPALLLHGNYCGPGNNAPLAPIDALDTACARHDACTPTGALASKACNARLKRDAELISRDPWQPEDLRALAGLVSAGASMMPSAPPMAGTPAIRSYHGRAPIQQHSGLYQGAPWGAEEAGRE